jgi:hypothetical protein
VLITFIKKLHYFFGSIKNNLTFAIVLSHLNQSIMTQFETAIAQAEMGELQTPSVSYGKTAIDYFWYQVSVHHFNLKIMASGMKCRGIKFTDIKKYYGLKGNCAKKCLAQFENVVTRYRLKMINDHLNTMETEYSF